MAEQYDPEVQAVLFGYANVYQHTGGKWVAELLPEMLNPFIQQKMPPGQSTYVGAKGFISEYADDLVRKKTANGWTTLHDMQLWASVPHFHSFEAAQGCIMGWLNDERLDLVAQSRQFVQDARSYRATQARRPVFHKPPPTMWDQLLS